MLVLSLERGGTVLRTRLLLAPTIILLWQTAPVSMQPDAAGRFRVSFGYGSGQWEDRRLSCSGAVLSARPVEYDVIGTQIDAWVNPTVRFSAFGGSWSGDPYAGGVLAAESRYVGLGFGYVRLPGSVHGGGEPSVYGRLGSIDRLHFRFDHFAPNPSPFSTGPSRAGLGFNQGHRRGVGAFGGWSFGPYTDQSHVGGPFLELRIPVCSRFDILAGGAWRPSAEFPEWGLGVGGRVNFGAWNPR